MNKITLRDEYGQSSTFYITKDGVVAPKHWYIAPLDTVLFPCFESTSYESTPQMRQEAQEMQEACMSFQKKEGSCPFGKIVCPMWEIKELKDESQN